MTGICGHIPGVTCSNCRPAPSSSWVTLPPSDLGRIANALEKLVDTLTAAVRYAANEERQRKEAEPDPLNEGDWRDRVDADGDRLTRRGVRRWNYWDVECASDSSSPEPLAYFDAVYGPLAFAPEPPQEATGADQSASEGESGHVEGPATDNAQNAILCPECGHDIDRHTHDCPGDRCWDCDDCRLTPSTIARALIAAAAKPTWCPKCGHHTDDHHDGGCVTLCECTWEANTDG